MKIKVVRTILQILKTIFLLLFINLCLYLIIATLLSLLATQKNKVVCHSDQEFFITTNGIHLDVVLPIENVNTEFISKLLILPGTKYVSFGWGDREFYINTPEWKDLTFNTAFKALFLKSETAMHISCYFQKQNSWKKLNLCPSQLDILNSYIEKSFQLSKNGSLQKITVRGYYDYDAFYEAKGSFSLFNTCNVWVNKALKKCGVKTSVWSPFDLGVLYHLPK